MRYWVMIAVVAATLGLALAGLPWAEEGDLHDEPTCPWMDGGLR